MEVTAKLTGLKYVIELTPDEAEEILEYLSADDSVLRRDDLIKALKKAGVRDVTEEAVKKITW